MEFNCFCDKSVCILVNFWKLIWYIFDVCSVLLFLHLCLTCVWCHFFFKVEGALFFCLIPCGCPGVTSHLFTYGHMVFPFPFSLPLSAAGIPSGVPSGAFQPENTGKTPTPFTLNFLAPLLQSCEIEALAFKAKLQHYLWFLLQWWCLAQLLVHGTGCWRTFVPF